MYSRLAYKALPWPLSKHIYVVADSPPLKAQLCLAFFFEDLVTDTKTGIGRLCALTARDFFGYEENSYPYDF